MIESSDRCPGKPRGGCYRAPVHRNHRLNRTINWRPNLPLRFCARGWRRAGRPGSYCASAGSRFCCAAWFDQPEVLA